ncbi:hypothetical protein BST28_18760 [Mycolicibacter kumamotonensis]|uniref:DUF4406 domain-containing protein n=1 Tax=Mycolicibacter kumamotonensis TaxID=354243 RepID=A0A1X0DXI3_9MYCO|nr:DUF4406 domain-containing protein [Mycolicibacter kumamotonensis]ORA77164.1 hypothetical protein BST28_18760 [Mycolicibacter kumamotonensis]
MTSPDIYYIAGPMTGYVDFNYPAFEAKAAELREAGKSVISPAEIHPAEPLMPTDWYLRRDLAVLVLCSHIVFLPGWKSSKGSQLEHHVATALGMSITYPEGEAL